MALGLWLIDNMQLTELAKVCATQRRGKFLFAMLPWRFVGVTSSVTNPVGSPEPPGATAQRALQMLSTDPSRSG